jgi:methyl-accepting chemotaxis protein
MLNCKSISMRMMIAISLVAAISCGVLAAFAVWRQQVTVDVAMERELRAAYTNIVGALDAETRTVLAVASALAAMPQLRAKVRSGDRAATLKLLKGALDNIKPLGLELLTVQIHPATAFARAHTPDVFGDDVSQRRKMVLQSFSTRKSVGGVEPSFTLLNVFGTVPLLEGGDLLGSVDVGAPFGDAFVGRMKERFGVDLAIHQVAADDSKTFSSTIKEHRPELAMMRRAMNGEMIFGTGTEEGHPVATMLGPIKDFSGQPVALLEIALDTSTYRQLAHQSSIWLAGGAIAVIALAALIAVLVGRSLAQPILALQSAMKAITSGRHEVAIPGTARIDEIGAMAQTVLVFKDSLIETGRLRGDQERQRSEAEATRRQTLSALAAKFESGVGQVANSVRSAATELKETATMMAMASQEATVKTATVAENSEHASENANVVAAAIEQLNASINEIAQRVNDSASVASAAMIQASATSGEVLGLAEAAQKIGDVVGLIREIAERTNPLALNATIESARAEEAGRGFAVVASEVKALASQTSKATGEIAAQVTAIQAATQSSVQSIAAITGTIGKVNEIATAIASAVEEQGAAAREIASSVAEAARGTGAVSANISDVAQTARDTGAAATQVVEAATELSRNGAALKDQVDGFLHEVLAA